MKSKKTENGYVLVLERGEKVIATMTDFCVKEGIQSGFFQAIGAIKNTEIGYYSLEKKEYFFKVFPEDREVASMTGNIALVENKPFMHAHAVLSASDQGLTCVGGHVKEAEVAVTLEVFLTPLTSALERKHDDQIGLKLLNV